MLLSKMLEINNFNNGSSSINKFFETVPMVIIIGIVLSSITFVLVPIIVVLSIVKSKKKNTVNDYQKTETEKTKGRICSYCGSGIAEGESECKSCGANVTKTNNKV